MRYYSTRNKTEFNSFKEALLGGLAKDGGLYMPESIPRLSQKYFDEIENYSFQQIALEIAKHFIGDEIPQAKLEEIIYDAINFDAPLNYLTDELAILELFHGPTLAFKDFGARFMARTMEYFVRGNDDELVILVATSGDTGSAVANGFFAIEGIKVYVLYPQGKVSFIQEKQLTTLDKNITAVEVKGTFDDCQRLVKSAFVDNDLRTKVNLSSANSINISRLIPQSFYYFNAYRQVKDKSKKIIISIPSGNLGNLTAGLIAKKMGLPIYKFIGATNSNNVFTEFIETANFSPRESVLTLSNAMDVGNPSNLERINELYSNKIELIRDAVFSSSFDDNSTKEGIKNIYEKFNYIIDPHGAVGYLSLIDYVDKNKISNYTGIVAETAHPAKFKDAVEEVIGREVKIPIQLAESINKEKKSILLENNLAHLKEILL
ncbi:MAG: threonine synthase [Melioribacteraceae bacterium]|nr:threonine synthase [Melioribacteraceae bacterium]